MISFAEVAVGRGGIVACRQCAPAEPATFVPAEQVLAHVRAAVSAWQAEPGPNVAFVGAEPFAHPELPALVTGAVEAGASRIRLRTDGRALIVSDNAAGALLAGVRHLELVLLAGDQASHDALCGRPGSFAEAIAGAAAFCEAAASEHAPIALAGLVPVCPHNLHDVAAAIGALAHAGAVTVTLDVSPPVATSAGSTSWLAAAIETGTVNGAWVHVRGVPADKIPVSPLHALAAAGTVGVAE